MTTEKPTITWPDILNYLADRGYFTALSPIENKLHDGLLIKLNTLFFPEYLEISNTELHGLTGLSIKAIIQARESLIKKECYDNWIWKYHSRERQRLSGRYFFNYELIRNWIGTRQELKRNWQGRKQENVPDEYAENDNDPNITQPNLKETTTHNKSQDAVVIEDDFLNQENKEQIRETLKIYGLSYSNFERVLINNGWQKIAEAFSIARAKVIDQEIATEKFVGYFLGILKPE